MGVLDAQLVPAVDGVAYGLLLFVVASGLSLAFGTAGVLNLAHGTLYAIGAYTGAELSDGTWGGLALGLAAGTSAACAAGALLSLATAPLSRRGHLAQALLTFGLALMGGNLLVELFGADELPVRIPEALDASVSLLGHRYPAYRLVFIAMAVLLAGAGTWVLTRTRAGAAVRAAADDPQMLATTGTDPRAVHTGVLAAAGALAGAAGVLGAPIVGPGPGTAESVLMLSLVVVVLGGLRSLWGTLLAAVAVGEVQTLGVSLVPDWAPYLLFAAMAAVLTVRARRSALPEPGGGAGTARAGTAGAGTAGATATAIKAARAFTAAAAPVRRWRRPARTGGRYAGRARGAGGATGRARGAGPFIALCCLLAAVPWVFDAYSITLAGYALSLGLVAVGAGIMTGYAGLPTLGQTAPFAVGAYTTALLAQAGWTVGPVQLAVSCGAAALFSAVTGPAVIRARGTTVLMITLAIGELAGTAIGEMKSVTGGTDGIGGFPPAQPLWGAGALEGESAVYGYVVVVTAAVLAVTLVVLRSPAGKLLTGTRTAEERMRASGHPVGRYLLLAHIGAGTLAGVGGSLMINVQQYVSPADVGFEIAALALLAAVIGGATSVVGAVLGAGLIVFTRDWLSASWPGHGPLLLGALFVIAVYALPRGLAGIRFPTRRDGPRGTPATTPGNGSPDTPPSAAPSAPCSDSSSPSSPGSSSSDPSSDSSSDESPARKAPS
ncbi:ABC transporter permease [Streptomyces iconiensis]|uniref:ABC transporter permease n=1 Tax=Streptomyces iconiensis TaxID=1384038 RepID=A0ABT6ZX45_9ACTN|nr:ABC transporter permease [Streptomyces iconiensis]MDJ1133635.1 ABC transporter permease [Streptomyces iconiensis]